MFSLIAATRSSSITLSMAAILLGASVPAHAATGTVHIHFAKAGLFVGVGGASGVLHFHGQDYALDISGLSIGTIGLGRTELTGHAHNLRHAADINGSYTAVSVSMAIGGGRKVARLQNSNNMVYLQLEGSQIGLELSASVSGMTISLQ